MRKKKEVREELEDFVPPIEEGDEEENLPENIIKKIPPAKWEGLIEVLDFLTKDSDDSVIINDSVILYGYQGGSIIRADLNEIFDGQKISLHISSPKKWTRLFKIMKDGNIYIIDDQNKFVVTNEQIKLFLPKQLNSVVNSLEFPTFDHCETICEAILQKEDRNKIIHLRKDYNYLEYLIKDGKLMCVNVPNTAVYILPEHLKNSEAKELNNSNSDLTLRSQIFLPYTSEIYKIMIGHNLITNSYFSYSVCRSSLISIKLYEQLDNASGIDDLF